MMMAGPSTAAPPGAGRANTPGCPSSNPLEIYRCRGIWVRPNTRGRRGGRGGRGGLSFPLTLRRRRREWRRAARRRRIEWETRSSVELATPRTHIVNHQVSLRQIEAVFVLEAGSERGGKVPVLGLRVMIVSSQVSRGTSGGEGGEWMDGWTTPSNEVYNYELGAAACSFVSGGVKYIDWKRVLCERSPGKEGGSRGGG